MYSQMAARSFTQACSQAHTQSFILTRCTHSQILHLTGFIVCDTWVWLCSGCVPCWEYHEAPSCPAQPCGSSQVCYWHSPTIRPLFKSHFYWLNFLLGTFQSNSLRNNKIFILSSLNIKCMEAVNKVEFPHNSHTTKYPLYPQCSWNSDFLSWDKQLASSDIFFHSVCQLFHWCTAFTTHLFRLLSARWSLVCCLISLFSGAKQNLWCHLRIPFTSTKLALVFKEMILIYVLPFWPRSIMICLYVEFFNDPSVPAGSRTKLNRGTGWHNVMQTSLPADFYILWKCWSLQS